MTLWKDPRSVVWYTVVCPRCHKVLSRLKLPGLFQKTTNRLCQKCSAEGGSAEREKAKATAKAKAGKESR